MSEEMLPEENPSQDAEAPVAAEPAQTAVAVDETGREAARF